MQIDKEYAPFPQTKVFFSILIENLSMLCFKKVGENL